MSEQLPYGAGPGSPGTPPSHDAGDPSGSTTGVKDRVTDAASHVGDAGREVAGDAKEKARDVAHEATDRARGLVDQTRTELRSQAGSQQQRLAQGLRSLGDELQQMAEGTQDPGYASDLVQRAGAATGQVAQWFEDREPSSVLREVEDFARRRAGTFLLLAAGAGLVVGRILRGMKDAPDTGSGGGDDRAAGAGTATGLGTSTASGLGTGASGGVEGGAPTGGRPTGAHLAGSGLETGGPDPAAGGTRATAGGLPVDPESPTTPEPGYPPPAFPPTTSGTGTGTTGGVTDVDRP